MRDKAPLLPDAERSQSETGGRNARYSAAVIRADIAPIPHQSSLWIRLFYEVQTIGTLQFIQELVIVLR